MAKQHKPYKKRLWEQEHIDYMLSIRKGRFSNEIADMINDKFGTTYTKQQVSSFMTNNHYTTGADATFKKGTVPPNKGKKWDDYMSKESQEKSKENCYKKGHISANNVPIGTLSLRKDKHGKYYKLIKIRDKCRGNNFVLYSRWVWENAYNTKLKPNQVVIHLDGDSLNDELDNLMAVEKKEVATLNKVYKVTNDKNRTKASVLTIRLNQRLKEIAK